MLKLGVISEVGRRFNEVSNQMANDVIEQFGDNIAGREEEISAGLKTQLSLNLMKDIESKLNNKKINNVKFNVQIFKKNTESKIGADLGFILEFVNGKEKIKKGFLIQSKICEIRNNNKGLTYYYCKKRKVGSNSNVLNQANFMLGNSSDSFFFLYTTHGIKVVPAFAIKLCGLRGIDSRNYYYRSFSFFMKDFFKCFIGDHMIAGIDEREDYLTTLHNDDKLKGLVKIQARIEKDVL